MASLWREVRNTGKYPLLKNILGFEIWCLASVEQMGFSIRSSWKKCGLCVSVISPEILPPNYTAMWFIH